MPTPNRRDTSLSLDTEVLDEARAMALDLSKAAEDGIARAIALEKAKRLAGITEEIIQSNNEYVEKHGLPLAKYRMF